MIGGQSADGRVGPLGLSAATWGKAGVLAGLFAALFWVNLRRLWLKTNPFTGEPNWGHAIVVPVVGLYYLFLHRETIAEQFDGQFVWGQFARRGRLWAGLSMVAAGAGLYFGLAGHGGTAASLARRVGEGVGLLGGLVLVLDWSLAVLLFGLGMFAYGIWPGQNDYLKDLGMVATLYGVVLLTCGRGVMRTAWFPIVFLICALPWPVLVYSWVAEPLQELAARVAVWTLQLTGVNAVTSGTKIVMNPPFGVDRPPRVLNVAEACAGMRSLMTFVTLGGGIAFLSKGGGRPMWQKVLIVASAVPIAIACNVMRISGQGLLDYHVSPKWSEGFAHQAVGLVMLVPALFLILFVTWVLDKLFVEVADDEDEVVPAKAAAPVPAAVLTRPAPAVLTRPAVGVIPPRPRLTPSALTPPTLTPPAGPNVTPAQS